MLKWLTLLLDDARTAESRILGPLLKESPEYPDWSAAVQPVLRRLLDGSRLKRPMVCRVLDIPVYNAFALPHQTIVLSQLLVEFCRDRVDQLAFVLGHEVAHIHLGHARERSFADAAMTVAPLANPLLGIGLGFLFDRAYTREQEFEADTWAVRLSARAGYAPSASVALLERLGHGGAPSNLVAAMLSTHPPMADRMQQLHAAIRECRFPGRAIY
ncbi:MAG: M48 family metalloprotease [Gemmataceae bacterium]